MTWPKAISARCPWCGWITAFRSDGRLRVHKDRGRRCEGSGTSGEAALEANRVEMAAILRDRAGNHGERR